MSYVFSDTLICDDAASAKLVTFSKEVGVKSVTLDGDVYDPSGTLSGGSAPSGSGVLVQVQELIEAEGNLTQARETLTKLERESARSQGAREQWRSLSRDVGLKEHELELLQKQVDASNASRVRWLYTVSEAITDSSGVYARSVAKSSR